MAQTRSSIPFLEKLGFGLGELGNNLFWQFFMYFQFYFYTDVFKIAEGVEAAAVAGKMFLYVKVVDAVFDVVIGVVADRTKTRWGKYRPYLLWGAIPFALAGLLAFSTPDLAHDMKLVYAYVTYTFLMMMYSLVAIPQNSLLGVMTDDTIERTVLSKYKFVFAFISGIVVQFCTPLLVKALGHGSDTKGYQMAVVVYGIIALAFFLLAFLVVRERVSPPPEQKSDLGKDFKQLASNWPWIVLCIATFASILHIAVRSGSFIYYFKYLVGTATVDTIFFGVHTFTYDQLMGAYMIFGTLCTIGGTFLVPTLTRIFGKRLLYCLLMGGSTLICVAYYFVPPTDVRTVFILQVFASLTLGPTSAVLWPMYADCADYSEWKNSRRATALVFSAAIMMQKLGWAVAADIQGSLMKASGYIPDSVLTAEATRGLLMTNTLIPGAFGLLAVVALLFYPLNERRLTEIETDLKARRAKAA